LLLPRAWKFGTELAVRGLQIRRGITEAGGGNDEVLEGQVPTWRTAAGKKGAPRPVGINVVMKTYEK